MLFTENEDGTYRVQSETEEESQVVQVLIELACLAWKGGALTDDQINDHGFTGDVHHARNYCTIPGQDWVSREAEKCAA